MKQRWGNITMIYDFCFSHFLLFMTSKIPFSRRRYILMRRDMIILIDSNSHPSYLTS